jgi:hypothetical protein
MKADAEPLSAPPRYQPPNPNSLARPRSTNDVIKRLNDNIMSKQQGGAAGQPQPPSASSELAALLKADSGVCWVLFLEPDLAGTVAKTVYPLAAIFYCLSGVFSSSRCRRALVFRTSLSCATSALSAPQGQRYTHQQAYTRTK